MTNLIKAIWLEANYQNYVRTLKELTILDPMDRPWAAKVLARETDYKRMCA